VAGMGTIPNLRVCPQGAPLNSNTRSRFAVPPSAGRATYWSLRAAERAAQRLPANCAIRLLASPLSSYSVAAGESVGYLRRPMGACTGPKCSGPRGAISLFSPLRDVLGKCRRTSNGAHPGTSTGARLSHSGRPHRGTTALHRQAPLRLRFKESGQAGCRDAPHLSLRTVRLPSC